MSTPKYHHFVSRCQINEFFDHSRQRIFILDKKTGHISLKNSTKRILGEEFGNSFASDADIDNTTLEFQLKTLFEDKYPQHLDRVKELIETGKVTDEIYYSLYCLATIGIIGEMRNPVNKRNIDHTVFEMNSEILNRFYGIPKSFTIHLQKSEQETPNRNLVDYFSVAINTISKLDPLEFSVYALQTDETFLLPDTSGFIIRGQLEKYINPNIQEIIQVGIPISSKIFILASPKKLNLNENKLVRIKDNNSDLIKSINSDLFEFAIERVVCADRETLEKIKNDCAQQRI